MPFTDKEPHSENLMFMNGALTMGIFQKSVKPLEIFKIVYRMCLFIQQQL